MPFARRLAAVCVLVIAVDAAVDALPAAQVSKRDRDVAVQMLKQVREDLQEHYYDPGFRGIDITARFEQAEAKVRAATGINEISTVLVDLLLEFNDSHTRFYLPQRAVRVEYGWGMSIVGDDAVVTAVTKGSDAEVKGLRPGDRVLWLNRHQPTRKNLPWLRYYYRAVRPQAAQRVVVRKLDGAEAVYDIASKVREVPVMQLEDLIDEIIHSAEGGAGDRNQTVELGNILIWRMKAFGEKRPVEQALARARRFKTLIIDMRGNSGGAVDTLMRMVSLTFDREVTVAVEKTRKKMQTDIAKPAKDAFDGAIIALVDSESASAAEVYSRVLQIEKRGSVMGDRTAGAVMTSRFFSHTVGAGAIAFYGTSITVGDVRMSDGASLENAGVVPDVPVLPSPADVAAPRDPALARAVEAAGGRLTPEAAAKLFK